MSSDLHLLSGGSGLDHGVEGDQQLPDVGHEAGRGVVTDAACREAIELTRRYVRYLAGPRRQAPVIGEGQR